jgi:hypothetical protein
MILTVEGIKFAVSVVDSSVWSKPRLRLYDPDRYRVIYYADLNGFDDPVNNITISTEVLVQSVKDIIQNNDVHLIDAYFGCLADQMGITVKIPYKTGFVSRALGANIEYGHERTPFIVSLIYYQATKEKFTELKAQNDELKVQNAELKTQLNRIESMLLKLTTP